MHRLRHQILALAIESCEGHDDDFAFAPHDDRPNSAFELAQHCGSGDDSVLHVQVDDSNGDTAFLETEEVYQTFLVGDELLQHGERREAGD